MHKSNKHKDKLRESGDPYDYKLADFTYTCERIGWNLIKQYGNQQVLLFPLEKPRKSPPQTRHLNSLSPYNSVLNVRRYRIYGIYQLSEHSDSWSEDTTAGLQAGYLHSLNLGNSHQQLNLQELA